MEESFKPGDIAYVYCPCIYCGNDDDVGEVIQITKIRGPRSPEVAYAVCCSHSDTTLVAEHTNSKGQEGKFLWCLKKIPPLKDLDGLVDERDLPVETAHTC